MSAATDRLIASMNARGFQIKEPAPHAKPAPRIPEDIPEPAPARKAQIARWTMLLAPRLRALAERRQAYGIVADDSRRLAIEAGIGTGEEKDQRAWSWLAGLPRAAGLLATDRTRMNPQRNAQRVFVALGWEK